MNAKKMKSIRKVARKLATLKETTYTDANIKNKVYASGENRIPYTTGTKILDRRCLKGLVKELKKSFS